MNGRSVEQDIGPGAMADLLRVQRLFLLGKLACGIGHDMANMTMFLGFKLAKFEASVAGNPKALEILNDVKRTIDTLQELSRKMVSLSHEHRPQSRVVDANVVVRDVMALMSGALCKNIKTIVSCPATPVEVLCDPVLLDQVLLNLLLNAREAISDTGHISVKVSLCAVTGASGDGGPPATNSTYVSLTVKDDGCGMSSDVLMRAFEPFFTTKNSGTGMGLSVVKNAVDEMGGILRIHSQLDQGTTVEVLLKRWVG